MINDTNILPRFRAPLRTPGPRYFAPPLPLPLPPPLAGLVTTPLVLGISGFRDHSLFMTGGGLAKRGWVMRYF
jgi:hypothetical protein